MKKAAGTVKPFMSAEVQTGGALTAWQTANNGGTNRGSYGAAAASNQVFVLGGTGPVASRESGAFVAGGTLASVNAIPGVLVVAREMMGTALGSGRIFVVGGNTGAGITDSVESMVW